MKLPRHLRALFRKEELDQQLSDEMAFHLEKQIEQNLAKGMTAEEARYAALRKFGGVEQVKEECRDMRGEIISRTFSKMSVTACGNCAEARASRWLQSSLWRWGLERTLGSSV